MSSALFQFHTAGEKSCMSSLSPEYCIKPAVITGIYFNENDWRNRENCLISIVLFPGRFFNRSNESGYDVSYSFTCGYTPASLSGVSRALLQWCWLSFHWKFSRMSLYHSWECPHRRTGWSNTKVCCQFLHSFSLDLTKINHKQYWFTLASNIYFHLYFLKSILFMLG